MSNPDIPGRIKRARQSRKLSQQELAEQLGVSKSTVRNWESGRNEPTNLVTLEEFFGEDFGAPSVISVEPPEKWSEQDQKIREVLSKHYPIITKSPAEGDNPPGDNYVKMLADKEIFRLFSNASVFQYACQIRGANPELVKLFEQLSYALLSSTVEIVFQTPGAWVWEKIPGADVTPSSLTDPDQEEAGKDDDHGKGPEQVRDDRNQPTVVGPDAAGGDPVDEAIAASEAAAVEASKLDDDHLPARTQEQKAAGGSRTRWQ